MKCSRCLFDSSIPNITFDDDGECNYCKLHNKWEEEYLIRKLLRIIKRIKSRRKWCASPYDCIVGVSGGQDSSFLLYKTVEWGLNPLAVHWDNNWDSKIAEDNLKTMIQKINVDFYQVGVDQNKYDSICRSFLLASVPDADIPNDIALTTVLYYAAQRFKVKYILNAHSFRTEGTSPLGWSYMDGKYVECIQQKFGKLSLKSFPNLWLRKWLHWVIIDRIKRIRPLWYLSYKKEEVKELLQNKFGWLWYGGHHLENNYTTFVSNYLQPRKFGIDLRLVEYSALIRSGQMRKTEALWKIKEPPEISDAILKEVKSRLHFSDEEFNEMMKQPKNTYQDYETYHSTFKRWKWLFWIAQKMDLIPKTFYVKYTS